MNLCPSSAIDWHGTSCWGASLKQKGIVFWGGSWQLIWNGRASSSIWLLLFAGRNPDKGIWLLWKVSSICWGLQKESVASVQWPSKRNAHVGFHLGVDIYNAGKWSELISFLKPTRVGECSPVGMRSVPVVLWYVPYQFTLSSQPLSSHPLDRTLPQNQGLCHIHLHSYP